jgi:site-specific DNA recombinase
MDGCYCYVRVSTEEQAEGYSPEAQERAALALAAAEGLRVCGMYRDLGESARSDKRPDFQRMMVELKQHYRRDRIKAIIIDNLDRFMRNLRLLLNFEHELSKLGIRLLSATEDIDTTSDSGMMMFQFKGMVAEQYLRNLSREVKKGLREKAQQGHWVGGICPYGYVRTDKDTIAPAGDASTEAVRRIFALYETKLYSYARLADALNSEAERWGRRFGVEAVRDILANRAYCGFVSCSGTHYPGKHEALATVEQWERCAAIRNARSNLKWTAENPRPASNPSSLLVGLGSCASCDQPLWSSTSGNPGSRQVYYRCAGSSRRNCIAKLQPARLVDAQMLDLVRGFGLAAATQAEGLHQLLAESSPPPSPPAVDQAAIQEKLDRLTSAWVEGNISDMAYERQLATLKGQLNHEAAAPTMITMLDVTRATALLADLSAVIDEATIEERRVLVQMVFAQVWVQDRAVYAVQPQPLYGALWLAARRAYTKRCEAGHQAPFPAPLTPFGDLWRSVPLWSDYAIPFNTPVTSSGISVRP